jgi:hypothetical protein
MTKNNTTKAHITTTFAILAMYAYYYNLHVIETPL